MQTTITQKSTITILLHLHRITQSPDVILSLLSPQSHSRVLLHLKRTSQSPILVLHHVTLNSSPPNILKHHFMWMQSNLAGAMQHLRLN